MMRRRLQLMRELGLAPVWRLREGMAVANLALTSPHVIVGSLPSDLPATESAPVVDIPPVPMIKLSSVAPVVPAAKQKPDWLALQQDVMQCQACSLCQTRTRTVFGKGNPQARIMLIGEAPGAEEDRQGLPFVGKAGQLLDNMLAAVGLSIDDVYIANVLKCRPPANRNPMGEEVAACSDYLRWQIDHVQPDILVTLGRFAAHALLQTDAAIGTLRKGVHQYQGIPLFVTFHPAYLLRSPGEKAKAWQDLLAIRRTLGKMG